MSDQLPTQSRYPNRAMMRTIAAAIVGFLFLAPEIARVAGIESVPWIAGALGVMAIITRVLAIPAVNDWLRQFIPFLAADTDPQDEED